MLGASSSALNIEHVRDVMPHAEDTEVVRYATESNRIVVTTETGINHKKFKICTHHGIIVFCGGKRHQSIRAEAFRKFMLSGHRKKTRHAVTYLSEDQARIKTTDRASDDEIIPL